MGALCAGARGPVLNVPSSVSGCPAVRNPRCQALFLKAPSSRPRQGTRGVCAAKCGTQLRHPQSSPRRGWDSRTVFVTKLSPAHAVSEVPPHPHPKPHVLAAAGLSFHLCAARRRLLLLLARSDPGAARRDPATLLPPPVPTTRLPGTAAPWCSESRRRRNPGACGPAGPSLATPLRLPTQGRHAPAPGVRARLGSSAAPR